MTKTQDLYCTKCEKYLFGQVVRHHEEKPYCLSCYDKLFIAETEEPRIVQLEGKAQMGSFARAIVIDDAPALGESDHIERDDSVNIPLPLQKRLLHSSFYDSLQWLVELLDDDDFVCDLEKMAEARLEQAHPKWGSTMYAWHPEKRWRAIMEELADVFVYKSSEV